uniref:Homing endonuclease LAGLIDADG domain-containing protein n=1 Tax=Nakaseomyces nivariensis TaxID=418086 RepID=A0A2D0W419_9SACH|nr:hypothetical protein [Nakaseomyces nivariensis]APD15131.1 hypothetical protein [Nakaseomyces nivariensis]
MNSFSKNIKLIRNYIYNNTLYMNTLNNKNILKLYSKFNMNYIKSNNMTTDMVVYGTNLSYINNLSNYSNNIKYMINIPNNIMSIIVGILLTNGHIEYKSKKNLDIKQDWEIYSRFKLKTSMDNIEYMIYIYMLLSHYCVSMPKLKINRMRGKTYKVLELNTMALPCFTMLRKHFYNKRIKIVPNDLYDLLTYESLAHMIMNSGSYSNKNKRGIYLNLYSFTTKELITIMNILNIKFNLDVTLHKSMNKYTIYINLNKSKLYSNINKYIIINSMRNKFKM